MPFYNADGLYVRYGAEKVGVVQGGEYQGAGALRTIELEINAATLGTTSTILAEGVIIPRNSRIEQVELISETALTNLTSVDVGLYRLDNTTAINDAAIVSAVPLSAINANGKKNTYVVGTTNAGTLIGTTTAYPGLISARRVGTVGVGRLILRVFIYVPDQEPVSNYVF